MKNQSYSCTSRVYKNLLEDNAVFVSSSALSGYLDIMTILTLLALIQRLWVFLCLKCHLTSKRSTNHP